MRGDENTNDSLETLTNRTPMLLTSIVHFLNLPVNPTTTEHQERHADAQCVHRQDENEMAKEQSSGDLPQL